MSRCGYSVVFVLVVFAVGVSVSAMIKPDTGKVEPIGAFGESSASEQLKKALEPAGSRISLSDGAYAEIWLRASVPAGKTESSGAVYTSIAESTLLGVISFVRQATDFRGQPIKPGAYTLRYALHPTDGNHLGISPIRDFLVLLPVATDQNPDAQFKFEELTKLSNKASGTNHPAVLSLAAPEKATGPAVQTNDHGHLVFSSRIKSQSGSEILIAFVVKGIAEQ